MQNNELQSDYITIDQVKAFDRVEHEYLMKTLEAFGLPNDFIEYIKTLYTEVKSKITINGDLTPALSITRGVRQGCALSAPLFVLSLEPLLRKVANSKKIRGFPMIGQETVKIAAYADAIALFIRDTSSLCTFEQIFFEYSQISGA